MIHKTSHYMTGAKPLTGLRRFRRLNTQLLGTRDPPIVFDAPSELAQVQVIATICPRSLPRDFRFATQRACDLRVCDMPMPPVLHYSPRPCREIAYRDIAIPAAMCAGLSVPRSPTLRDLSPRVSAGGRL
jgi:hypothetical protein